MTNKSAPPLDEIDLLVGWRAGKDEYLLTKELPWSVSGCSTRRGKIAFVTSLRRFWLKQGHRPKIAPSISSTLVLPGRAGAAIGGQAAHARRVARDGQRAQFLEAGA